MSSKNNNKYLKVTFVVTRSFVRHKHAKIEEIKKWLVIADFSRGPGEIYVPNL